MEIKRRTVVAVSVDDAKVVEVVVVVVLTVVVVVVVTGASPYRKRQVYLMLPLESLPTTLNGRAVRVPCITTTEPSTDTQTVVAGSQFETAGGWML